MPAKPIKDYLGNEYPSIIKMCEFYGISREAYKTRINLGWSIEKALTTPVSKDYIPNAKACKDHLGNKYRTKSDMVAAYGIRFNTFDRRINAGWSLEAALTLPVRTVYKPVTDPFGKVYPNLKAMCDDYGVNRTTYNSRIKAGETQAQALGIENRNRHSLKPDPIEYKGTVYNGGYKELCKKIGFPVETFRSRKKLGWDVERIISTPLPSKVKDRITDHKGIMYDSFTSMCKAYNKTDSTVKRRLDTGWSKKDALENEIEYSNIKKDGKECVDHLGNVYPSIAALCRAYNIKVTAFKERIDRGWSLKDALEKPYKEQKKFDYPDYPVKQKCGLFVRYEDCQFIFEDGTVIPYNTYRGPSKMLNGTIPHPTLTSHPRRKGSFCGYITKYIGVDPDGDIWYDVEKDGVKDILTPQMMMERSGISSQLS